MNTGTVPPGPRTTRKLITAWTPEGEVRQKDATRLTLDEAYETEVVLYDRRFKTWVANRAEFTAATAGEPS